MVGLFLPVDNDVIEFMVPDHLPGSIDDHRRMDPSRRVYPTYHRVSGADRFAVAQIESWQGGRSRRRSEVNGRAGSAHSVVAHRLQGQVIVGIGSQTKNRYGDLRG